MVRQLETMKMRQRISQDLQLSYVQHQLCPAAQMHILTGGADRGTLCGAAERNPFHPDYTVAKWPQ